jgi:hypothetical protein
MSVTSVLRKIKRSLFLAVLGLGLTGGAIAVEPAQPSPNQAMANWIAMAVRQNPNLHDFTLSITYLDGSVEVAGTVADQAQREMLLGQVQRLPNVAHVVDRLTIGSGATIKQVQGSGSEPGSDRPPLLLAPPPDLRAAQPGAEGAAQGEPVPIFQAPPPSAMDVGVPRMPPYAWPTYAPYNNFSRVAYPLAYPYSAWPFIGPVYPFPKVPPGWRKVQLEWEDGHWWFSKVACQHDWWHLRFW